jgi:hypothetical protein
MMAVPTCRWISLAALIAVILLVGCNRRSYQVAEVDGVVLIKGKPGNKISVQFIPEVRGEASPPTSNASTDDQGHFTLQLIGPGGTIEPGAVVGGHRVVLRDLQLAASPNAKGVPIRLPIEYTMPASTPLRQEVKAGKQTIEINVPPR